MTSTPQPPLGSYPPPAVKRDTTLAWLAHLLMLFTWFIGPLVIWLVKKDEDKYAAYHGKQAFFWSLGVTVIFFGFWISTLLVTFVMAPLAFLGACVTPIVGLANMVYVLYAIIETAHGKPFKYFFVSDQFCKKEFAEAYPDLAAPAAPVTPPTSPTPPAAP